MAAIKMPKFQNTKAVYAKPQSNLEKLSETC